jgi:AraC family transcriptional regulator
MSEPAPSETYRHVHLGRVNAVVDYIEAHVHDDLTVESLAHVAGFSPFHFHRIFSAMTGETLGQFIGRIRIERAATLLVAHPSRSITEIAVSSGFSNPSAFSRAFRQTYGMSPTEWRRGGHARHEKRAAVFSSFGGPGSWEHQGFGIERIRLDGNGRSVWDVRAGALGMTTVRIEQHDAVEVAYVRHTGRYEGLGEVFTDLFTRLLTWAEPRGFVGAGTALYSVYHDNPSLTEDDRLRVSVCVPVPPATRPDGPIGRLRLPGGRYAVATFELGEKDYGHAWYAMDAGWLPGSGYEPDDRLPFERFFVGRQASAPDAEVVDICIPVRPARSF